MSISFPQIVFRWQTSAGLPAVGYRIFFYEANDVFDTLKPVFADFELTVPLDSPVELNAEGYAAVYAGEGTYQVRILKPEGDDTVVYSSGTIQGSALTSDTVVVSTVDAMRDLVAGSAGVVIVANYSDSENPDGAGDGGGGVFPYDSACTLDDDGVIVFAPTSAPAEGRYIRQFSGPVDIRFGGQVGNGQAQTAPNLQGVFEAAVAYAESMQEAGGGLADVYFPPGNYLISDDETWDQSVRLIFAEGAHLSIATGKTLTIQCPFTKGRDTLFAYDSPDYTGSVDLSGCPLEEVFPDWFGFDTLAFERMCASGFVCKASLNSSADYAIEQSGTISFPGSGIVGNGSQLTFAEDISISFTQADIFITDLNISGNGFSLTLAGTNGVISGLNCSGMVALINSGGLVLDFDRLTIGAVQIVAGSAAAGSSAGRIIGGFVNILSSKVTNSGGVKYGWSFESAAIVTLLGPTGGTFDTADYVTSGGAVYSVYGSYARVSGYITAESYIAAASFLQGQTPNGTQAFRAGGRISKYNDATGITATGDSNPHNLVGFTLKTGTLDTVGDSIRIRGGGTSAVTAGKTVTIALKIGSTSIFSVSKNTGASANTDWDFDIEITKTASGKVTAFGKISFTAQADDCQQVAVEQGAETAVTLTGDPTLQIIGTSTGGDFVQNTLMVDHTPAPI